PKKNIFCGFVLNKKKNDCRRNGGLPLCTSNTF
ncbi:MAG: hypothetical protein ACI8RA_002641, partial [Chlamydiales bacterium]